MASEIPNQKRKRGRPLNASKTGEDASGRAEETTTTRRSKPAEKTQTEDAEGASNAGAKKRGRPKKTLDIDPLEDDATPAVLEKQSKRGPKAGEEPVAEEPPNPRKRGRPPKERTEDASPDAQESRPRKRSKPSPDVDEPVEDEDEPVSGPTKKPRGRPSKDTKVAEKGLRGRKEVASAEEEPAQKEDVRRSKRSTNSSQQSSKNTQRGKENRRDLSADQNSSRASLREVPVSLAQNRMSPPQNEQTTKSRKGNKVAEAEDADIEEDAPKRQRRRGQAVPEAEYPERPEVAQNKKRGPAHRPPNATKTEKAVPAAATKKQRAEKQSTKDSEANTTGPADKPRRRKNAEPDENEEPAAQQPKEAKENPAPVPKYRHLTSRTRQIPRSTIASKWSPLDPPSIATVDSIIADASRPILFRLRETRSDSSRHAHAQDILTTFASRLHKKLEKGMPFPPPSIPSVSKQQPRDANGESAAAGAASHDAEFDFEQTINAIQALERTLDPLLHSVALLKREKEKEEQELERAYRRLRTLETNARTQSRGWRERGKRDHVLAPGIRPTGLGAAREWEEEGEIELVKKSTEDGKTSGSVFKEIEGDEELVKVAQQLGSHMESMRGNLEQIEGVVPAMEKTKGALQGVLQKYLDEKQYEQVVFG
ncbi:CENP-Q, a CENPA-CAD centromere complex subunit-domain-containing protein [Pseudoneurospora amorphoporcata]|uniref:CENP-Q, a CENPA-CAD centromere complex subunit-domain-containing protein n=1 Tax=Pseudoneurospora amorphoporcata TaxID=241081 RepID=A0AAN6P4N4_9PEZI|nr:CENP-Q, a CENPA-CAD centromere complex subunit-domain-containing protein [Pseudoneurospora amorphoporcata]